MREFGRIMNALDELAIEGDQLVTGDPGHVLGTVLVAWPVNALSEVVIQGDQPPVS